MHKPELDKISDNLAILDALTVDSFEQFFKIHRLGDLEVLHTSYKACVEAISRYHIAQLQTTEPDPTLIDDLIAVISDYFYWINLTARSGYVQRDNVKPAYLACVTEEIDAIYRALTDMELKQVIKESFIILGVEGEADISYSRKGLVYLLENKFQENIIPDSDDLRDPRTITRRHITSIMPPHEDLPDKPDPQELWQQIIHQKQSPTTSLLEQSGSNRFFRISDLNQGSITPSSMDSGHHPASQTPPKVSDRIRQMIYGAAALATLLTAGSSAYYLTGNRETTSAQAATAPTTSASLTPPAPEKTAANPLSSASPTVETKPRSHCLIDQSPATNPSLQNLLTSLKNNAPPIYAASITDIIQSLDIEWPGNANDHDLQILLTSHLLNKLSRHPDPRLQNFAAIHQRNLEQYLQRNSWTPGQNQTAMIFKSMRPVRIVD